jgi:hypothetical protein
MSYFFLHNVEHSCRRMCSLRSVNSNDSISFSGSGSGSGSSQNSLWEPSEIKIGAAADRSYDSLNRNCSEEIDRDYLRQSPVQTRKCSSGRIDHIFGLSPFDTNGKPPLAPGRTHRARLNGSKSSGELLSTCQSYINAMVCRTFLTDLIDSCPQKDLHCFICNYLFLAVLM